MASRAAGVMLVSLLAVGVEGCGGGVSEVVAQEQGLQTARVPSTRYAGRVRFTAEGRADGRFVLPPAVPEPPPGLEWRARLAFPVGGKDVLDAQVLLAPVGAPSGVPPVFVVSQFRMRVDRFERSAVPEPNFSFSGKVIETPVPSPFGPIVGRLTSVTGGYTGGPDATFTLLGGPVAGSHATFLPVATGALVVDGDCGEDSER